MKATPQAQAALLELAACDTELDRIAHRLATLPEQQRCRDLEGQAETAAERVVRANTRVTDLERAVRKAEAEVEKVRARAQRDATLLNSGQIVATKQLTDLEHEIATLGRRQAELEDAELEVLELLEEAQAEVGAAEVAQQQVRDSLVVAQQDAATATAAAKAEQEQWQQRRDGVLSSIPADLLDLYQKIRRDTGGYAAGLVRYGRCEVCQMELATADLSEVRAAPADEVVRCPECRSIMVRTEESGL